MAALSAVVFALSWWLGLYLLARNPCRPVLLSAAVGPIGFAVVVALDAIRVANGADMLGRVEIYLVVLPGVAWFAVLLESSRPPDTARGRAGELIAVLCVVAAALAGAAMAGSVEDPLRPGHSFVATAAVALLFGGQVLVGMVFADPGTALVVLLFTSLALAIAVNVLADPLAGVLDRPAFLHSPDLRADRAVLSRTEAALPRRAANPFDDLDDETFAQLTRRALGHYGDHAKLVANP